MHRSNKVTYSITSSASICVEVDTSIPSALAVFMLMVSPNLVGWRTGGSAGFLRVRIWPVRVPPPVSIQYTSAIANQTAGIDELTSSNIVGILCVWPDRRFEHA